MSQQGIEIIGWIATVFTSLCFLPQFIKVIVQRSTKDLSLLMTISVLLANVLWIAWAVPTGATQVWATNACQMLIMLCIFGFKIYNIASKKEVFKLGWPFKKKTKTNQTEEEI